MSSSIVLLGASGYVGQAFVRELKKRGHSFIALSRRELDYTQFQTLLDFLGTNKPAFLINAAGYTGKPTVDACELARAETLAGNTLLPQTISHACEITGTPWGHVSSGCVYSGAKILAGGTERIEKNMGRPELKALAENSPAAIRGFSETDRPNFSFRDPPCSFYSGTKALAEEVLADFPQIHLWRLRIPFDEFDNARNFLSKVQRYAKVYDNVNSVSHRGDFVSACLDLWERRAPSGIYNLTNPGFVTTRQVIGWIRKILRPAREFQFWESDEEFYRVAAKTPRSNCVLDTSKLHAAGVTMRPVQEAIEDSLRKWQKE